MGLALLHPAGSARRAALLAAVAACALPAAAQATTASYSNSSGLRVDGGAGERNNIQVSLEGGSPQRYRVTETPVSTAPPAPVTAGAGCSSVSAQEVTCTRGGVAVVTINAGDGDDFVFMDCASQRTPESEGDGFIDGGDGNDQISGGIGFDAMDGRAGNDTVNGCAGNDTVNGGAGDDTVQGGFDNDTANGGDGNDTLPNGADGVDAISGGAGVDVVTHPSVVDASNAHNYSLDDVANDTDGPITGENIKSDVENVVMLQSGSVGDVLTGGPARNRLDGGGGNDTISGGSPATGSAFVAQLQPITITLQPISITDDVLIGGAGDDTLSGQGGNDRLEGGDGVDNYSGSTGDDAVLARDAITDVINCGSGTDRADLDLRDPDPPVSCENIDRGAINEGYNVGIPTRARTRSPAKVGVRLACRRSVEGGCRGTLSVTSIGSDRNSRTAATTRYALRRGQRRTVVVSLPARDRRTLARRRRVAVQVQSVETGSFGDKTTIRQLVVRLRR